MNTSTAHLGGSHQWTPGMSNMYPTTAQRDPSNPRSYAAQSQAVPAEQRRDDGQQQMYDAGTYANNFSGNVNYGGYGGYNTYASPSGSRRTSAPKPTLTPPTSAPVGTNPSPTDLPSQAPYSAPPVGHPYGGGGYGGYQQYYDYQWGPQPPRAQAEHRTPQSNYEYSNWSDQSRQQWQDQRQSNPWQAMHPSSMPAPSYPWQQQQQQQQQSWPPVSQQPVQGVAPPTPSSGKKEKGTKRPAEDSPDESKKKPKEKPVPQPPAKSHLNPPRQAQSAWQLFFADELNKAKEAAAQGNSPGGTVLHAKLNVAQIAKDAGNAYANLDEEQKIYYAKKVQESKEQYARELAVWRATLTPEDIRAENAFRAQQRKEGKSRKGNIKDPNAPKKPLSAYFLFLKDIRENDALREKVWGNESETTKQSVLAAERWRGLSDDEKRPFLAQAEHDKQEYEAARKIYEDEAAARARGEATPLVPADVPDIPVVRFEPGKSHKKKLPKALRAQQAAEAAARLTSTPPNPSSSAEPSDPAEIPHTSDDLHFDDPLENMFQTGSSNHEEWGELGKLMGEGDEAGSGADDKALAADPDTSLAPTVEEAEEADPDRGALPAETESEVQEVAAAAEGSVMMPTVMDEQGTLLDAPKIEEAAETVTDEQQPVDVMDDAGPAEELKVESAFSLPTPPLEPDTSDVPKAFETAALSGEVVPEAVEEPKPEDSAVAE